MKDEVVCIAFVAVLPGTRRRIGGKGLEKWRGLGLANDIENACRTWKLFD